MEVKKTYEEEGYQRGDYTLTFDKRLNVSVWRFDNRIPDDYISIEAYEDDSIAICISDEHEDFDTKMSYILNLFTNLYGEEEFIELAKSLKPKDERDKESYSEMLGYIKEMYK